MVKCVNIISEVISTTMDKFNQPIRVKQQYEKLFENLTKKNYLDSDIERIIESIELGDE